MSHVTYMNESCHTYELRANLLSVLMLGSSSITHMNESRHAYEWVMSHIWTSHVTHERVTWLIHLFLCWCWVLHLSHTRWLICMCDMTHSYVWHDSFICVTWLIHMCDMTHLSRTWTCDMTHPSITHIWIRDEEPSVMNESRVTWLIHLSHTYEWEMKNPASWMSHVSRMNESRHTWTCDMTHSSITRMNERHLPHIWGGYGE